MQRFPKSWMLATVLLSMIAMTGVGRTAILVESQTNRIMCVGDSITEGKFVGQGGYRKPLQALLGADGYTFVFVGKEDDGRPENQTGFSQGMDNPNHQGFGSMRIDEVLNGGSEEGHSTPPIAESIATYEPDVILLMLGTNDVLQNHEMASSGDRLQALLDAIFKANGNITVVLAEITPISGDRDAAVVKYNAQFDAIVAKEKALGHSIVLVDMHSALDPAKDLTDGVHPNSNGYAKIASVWYEALKNNEAKTAATSATDSATTAPAAAPPAPTVEAFSFSNAQAEQNPASYVLGFQFSTGNSPLKVGALGYLNDGATGAMATHQVGIYQADGKQLVTPVVSVTTSGGALSGQKATFTYVKLDKPVVLAAHTAYVIGAVEAGYGFLKCETGVAFHGIDPSSVHAAFTDGGAGLVFPGGTYAPNDPANVGPNFQVSP